MSETRNGAYRGGRVLAGHVRASSPNHCHPVGLPVRSVPRGRGWLR
jgi:hypothetical protein